MSSSDVYLPDLAELGITDLNAEIWLSRHRSGELRWMRVDDMTPEHRARLLAWIRDNAFILDRHQRRLIAHLRRARSIDDDTAWARLRALDESDPRVWIEDTPLVRRLVALADAPVHPPRSRARRLLPARLRFPLGGRS